MSQEDEIKKEINKIEDASSSIKDDPSDKKLEKSVVEKLLEENEIMEKEIRRRDELKAKLSLGGRSFIDPNKEKTQQQIDDEEASRLIKQFR